jgi:endonuclease/exonuclease/phosphatase family metal-dependent hydrolase
VAHLKAVRLLHIVAAAVAISACTATSMAVARPHTVPTAAAPTTCAARSEVDAVKFHISSKADSPELTRWCRAVGVPVYHASPAMRSPAPTLDQLTVVSWNAHLAEGQLGDLIATLRAGDLTGGKPVEHFVLLIQELYRRGDAVPAFDRGDRSAHAILPRDPEAADVDDHAAALGLSMLYVPSMRNGPELREDRGNAIISTEPLLDPIALELPLARQRRVTLGAAVAIDTADGVRRLELINAHLEPLSSPKTLWLFKNPRGRQMRAIIDLLDDDRYDEDERSAGVVLGGDFNTVRSGADEEAARLAREWSSGFKHEDRRVTHLMGRLDYVFFRGEGGWRIETRRAEERFGSDHHPIVATFSP